MGIKVYDQLKEIEQGMRVAYKNGCSIPCTIFRDIELYERYESMNTPKMDRYVILSEDFRINVSKVRAIVARLSKKI